jgi:hypothetical protein
MFYRSYTPGPPLGDFIGRFWLCSDKPQHRRERILPSGVRFPTHILQKQDGFPSLELTISGVKANVPADITVPESIRQAPPMPADVTPQQLADGVFWLSGRTHHSVAIAMKDYTVLTDTPNGEPRASAVIAKAKTLIPGKPTHPRRRQSLCRYDV